MTKQQRFWILLALAALAGLLAVQCRPAGPVIAPTPARTRVVPALPSATPYVAVTHTSSPEPAATDTSMPTAPPASATPIPTLPPPPDTPLPPPTDTPSPLPPTEPPLATPTLEPPTPRPPSPTPTAVSQPPLPPQEGGEWDMEAGFVAGASPLGEDCPGWAVAVGWQAFLAPGSPGSSCLNENKNLANVKSGERSQEITFDFISAEAGIWRRAQTIPGHRYRIEAWGKHVRSASPVELSLGVDLTGGEDWQSTSATWYPWDETEEEAWVHTQVTVRANSKTLTVFLKGYHPFAAQGGATLFDDVRVIDLGP